MYYSDEIIEQVRESNDIVDVIRSSVQLKKTGANYVGLCPFHNEKTGSFSVSGIKQMYYCFGCGKGGNVISFVMEYENLDFPDAIRFLADRAGISLPEQESTAQDRKIAGVKQQLLEINQKAAIFYYRYLCRNPQGKVGLDYFQSRGLSMQTITNFGLGYAPMYKDALYRYMKDEGYSDDVLRQSGLFSYKGEPSDFFWNRVMFPIMDANRRVIGFGGRVMGDAKPKYLNTNETLIFDKSRNLYGLYEAKHSKRGYILACEGYMDVIAMHQAGYTNAVASLGTALTAQHASILKRYTKLVILTYDSDGAGIKAALRAIPMFRAVGIRTRVLNLKPCKDPDEFLKTFGVEEFEKRIAEAENTFFFEVRILYESMDMNDPDQKSEFVRKVAEKLLDFEDAVDRESYTEAVANKYFISLDLLKKTVFAISNSQAYRKKEIEEARKEESSEAVIHMSDYMDSGDDVSGTVVMPGYSKASKRMGLAKDSGVGGVLQAQRLLISWISEEPSIYRAVEKYIRPEDFTVPLIREIAEAVFEQAKSGSVNGAQIVNRYVENESKYKEASALFFSKDVAEMDEHDKERILNETVQKIAMYSLETEAANVTDFSKLAEIMKRQEEIGKLWIRLVPQ